MAIISARGRPIHFMFGSMEHSNGDISAADHPTYSMFGSMVGFTASADRMALFPV